MPTPSVQTAASAVEWLGRLKSLQPTVVNRRFAVAFVLASVCLPAQDVRSQDLGPIDRSEPEALVTDVVSSDFTTTQPGKATLSITVRIKPGWKTFSTTQQRVKQGGPQATRIKLRPSDDYRVLGTYTTNAKVHVERHEDVWPGLDVQTLKGTVTWHADIIFAAGVDPAKVAVEGKIWCQVESSQTGRAALMKFVARSKREKNEPKNEKQALGPSTRHNAPEAAGRVRCFQRRPHRRGGYFKACDR